MTLPRGWANVTIEDVTEYVSRGRSPKYIEFSDLPVVNQKAVRWKGIEAQHLKYVDPQTESQWSSERFLKDGDILWNSTGTGTIGRASIFDLSKTFNRIVADSHVTIVRCNEAADPRYVFALIRSPRVQNVIEEMQSGSTNQVELNRSAVLQTEVPLPPLAEQRRIVKKLDALTARITRARAELERTIHLSKVLRERVLSYFYSEDNIKRWPGASIEEVVSEGLIGLIRSKEEQNSCGIPYIRMNHFDLNGRWNNESLTCVNASPAEMMRFELQPGDLLFNTRNSVELVGKVALWPESKPGHVYNNNLLRLRFTKNILPAFAYSYMKSSVFRALMAQEKSATTSVAAIYQRSLYRAPIPVPSLEEQQEIAKRIAEITARADRLEAEAARAKTLLDRLESAILAQAFKGELVPQDPDDEPAETLLARIRAQRAAGAQKPARGRRKAG